MMTSKAKSKTKEDIKQLDDARLSLERELENMLESFKKTIIRLKK